MNETDRRPLPVTSGNDADIALVVPIRSFSNAKTRLAGLFDEDARARITRFLAAQVLLAAPSTALVVSGDRAVLEWATQLGARGLHEPGNLNTAVRVGADFAFANGARRTIVSHADLVGPADFTGHASADSQTAITPCRHGIGSNGISFPSNDIPPFAYGPDSARRHLDVWAFGGRQSVIVQEASLTFDLDTDLDWFDLTAEQAQRLSVGADLRTTPPTSRQRFDGARQAKPH